jgi:hypothetical protein
MDNLDFTDKTHNEVLQMLGDATAWLRDQFSAARPIIISHPQITGKNDPMALFFQQADAAHLPTLISCTLAQMIYEPAPMLQLSDMEISNETVN